MPNSLRVNRTEEYASQSTGGTTGVSDADIGKDNWQAAPVAWGGGFFVLFMLLVAMTNAKFGDIKFPEFDKRDHVGFSGWKACSYGYKDNDMVWAKPYNMSLCTDAALQTCASKSMSKCQTVSFSNTEDVNEEYEESWTSCRAICPMFKWKQWCMNQACGGTKHEEQCQNVADAVLRDYVVEYGPQGAGLVAWKKGDMCRPIGDICDNHKSIKVPGDLGVVALVLVFLGQGSVLAYNSIHKTKDANTTKLVLTGSLVCWLSAWLFSFMSWATYLEASKGETTCVVEDASGTGAVFAKGPFNKIANSSYTYYCIITAWFLMKFIILAIGARLATGPSKPVETPPASPEALKLSPEALKLTTGTSDAQEPEVAVI